MKKTQVGAWVIHHGRKIENVAKAAAHYSAIDTAAKAATLLSRMAASNQSQLSRDQVQALGAAGGLNPKTELLICLDQLEQQAVINVGADGGVETLGITNNSALQHAADLFEHNSPNSYERAAIELGELASQEPVLQQRAAEYIEDSFQLSSTESKQFLMQSSQIGFVDHEGEGNDRLLFNGNLFRNGNIEKTKKVLDSLSPTEAALVSELFESLAKSGAMEQSKVELLLGKSLMSKLRAAAMFDESVIANDTGEFTFVTAPSAFHKFISPMEDDAFDQAKALVAALKYGMSISSEHRGRIWGISLLLKKLLRGEEVGPAPAIGEDYRALELDGVVAIRKERNRCFMKLRKRDVGEIALQVLTDGDASAAVLEKLPGAAVNRYEGPEQLRFEFRRKTQTAPSKKQTEDMLRAMRSGGGL